MITLIGRWPVVRATQYCGCAVTVLWLCCDCAVTDWCVQPDAVLDSRLQAPVDLGDTDLADVTSSANEDLVRLMTCIAEALVQHAGYTDHHFEALMHR